jgi:hypothetical protein
LHNTLHLRQPDKDAKNKWDDVLKTWF